MKQIGHYHIVKQVIAQPHPQGACETVEHGPLDAHDAGQNDVADTHYQQIAQGGIAFQIISHGHDPMPDAEEEADEQNHAGIGHFACKQTVKEAPEDAFFHPDINEVEADAKQDKEDSLLANSFSVQGKTAAKRL